MAQVADAIRTEILKGGWIDWIPSERELSQMFHVSRNTCRAALRTLYREKLLESVPGLGIKIDQPTVQKARSRSPHSVSVGLIIPQSVSRLRPTHSLLIEELREQLFDHQVRMHVYSSPAYYRARPQNALKRLVEKNQHACWILVLSHHSLQAWFAARGIPCVVSGSIYPDIRLPSVDYDYRAICRHAVGKLIGLGHRRIVFFNRQWRAAGDLESEVGFLEGINASPQGNVSGRVVLHLDDRQSVANLIRQLYAADSPPTALIVANSYCYLSVVTTLARLGLLVPRDVSVICREDDQFLAYVEPEPARYLNNSAALARKMMSLIRPLLEGNVSRLEPVRLLPQFNAGGSVRRI